MPLSSGARLGPYEVMSMLGAGGMGEVYRARDTRLGRDVAVKILPEAFIADPERLARFEREARLLATLNHPHIAAIYGVEHAGGLRGLILELIEGQTLADLMRAGPVSQAEALRIARQIADALDAAHAKGIIHRDLKPANISLTHEGVVKVLDFGLAKAISDEPSPDPAQSPTVALTGTAYGVILGTAAYMSPEQARGKAADKRTDIWAFGCVLYEMLTGRRAFPADEAPDVMAAILAKEPEWTALPPETSPSIERLLRRCLQKDRARRLADIADARLEIDEAQSGELPRHVPESRRLRTAERVAWVAAVATLAAVALAAMVTTRKSEPSARMMRLDVVTPPTIDVASFAISADGRRIVFVGTREGQAPLWLRSLDAISSRPLPGTEAARFPFWSPDGRAIAFYAEAQLKRFDIDTGSVRPLANAPLFLGGTWGRDGTILFVPDASGRIFRVSANGGETVAVTRLEPGQLSHHFPHFLPDGRHFLYGSTGGPSGRGVWVGNIDGTRPHRLLDAYTHAVYSTGHLLFARQNALVAQPFDLRNLEMGGEPFPLVDRVATFGFAGARVVALSAAPAGPVAYRVAAASETEEPRFQFTWFDRAGQKVGTVAEGVAPLNPSLSADERRVAFFNGGDIWFVDLRRSLLSRFTIGPSVDFAAVWSPDDSKIAFSSNSRGAYDLYLKSPTGAGREELLLATEYHKAPNDWSPDGEILVYRAFDPRTAFDIWTLSLKDRKPYPLVRTDADERNAQVSPDGRWIAYQSNETGRFEIWVQPFLRAGGVARGRWQVTTSGGIHVRWRRDGKELFYLAPDGNLMAMPFRVASEGQSVEPEPPIPLFRAHTTPNSMQGTVLPPYVVSNDGKRFLVVVSPIEPSTQPITVMLNGLPQRAK